MSQVGRPTAGAYRLSHTSATQRLSVFGFRGACYRPRLLRKAHDSDSLPSFPGTGCRPLANLRCRRRGPGAAGGMAAHVLTSQGMKVLLLEAGKKIPIEQELRSMEWPYDHPRRGEAPPGNHAIRFNEYTVRQPPYAKGSAFKHVFSYVGGWGGSDYVKNILVDEKDHPYTGTRYAWVRARLLGGKTNIWGRLALRL